MKHESKASRLRMVTVLGTRPQFVKAYPLSLRLRQTGCFDEVIVHTGQHFDPEMSDIFFTELGMESPRYFLNIHGGLHGEMTARMLTALEDILVREEPAAVLVYGDTNSTLAGALAAAKLHLPIIHVEAGLRSYNRLMPEEINRVVVDHLSSILLSPTRRAIANLRREGITQGVHKVGDLAFDAMLLAMPLSAQRSRILEQLRLEPRNYGVATFHRAENVDNQSQLEQIADYLQEESRQSPLILPLHPRTKRALGECGISLDPKRIKTTDPLGYLDMCRLVHEANVVITDSGGLQRESYFHRVPCVTLRDETEWIETIEHGWNRLWREPNYRPRSEIPDFGTETTAGPIVELLRSELASGR